MAWSDAARAAALEMRRRKAKGKPWRLRPARVKAGDVVRYTKPGSGERAIRLRVMEAHYGGKGMIPRVHAQAITGFERSRIKPVETVSPRELRKVRSPGLMKKLRRQGSKGGREVIQIRGSSGYDAFLKKWKGKG